MGNSDSPFEIPTEIPWQLAATTRPLGPQTLGGDLHAGGLFTLSVSDPPFVAPSLVTSGISKQSSAPVGILMDEDFDLSEGIHAHLQKYTNIYNFGVTQIMFGGDTAVVTNAIAHEGDNSYWTLKLPVD
jgi:hypothetical protein